jgi:hypothetical protein
VIPKPPNPRARALDLAIPVASCAGAGAGTGHLLAALSRDELTALVEVLALAASSDPVRLRAVVAAGDGMTPAMISREVLLRRAHTAANRLRRDGIDVPARLRVLDGEYRREREKVSGRKGRGKTAAREKRDAA